ncbi:MAG TPA: glycogen/starch/alpha-glucan family phosphorylase, partial [Anaeromyxobacteraceae bacterium]|nr:glycogen/starch/alpha-glucan family phosphorylase [Anaeromyxobacteraceae bacterium]
ALHSELLKQTVLRDFYQVMPGKFFNVTNGVTPRRWMVLSNPKLSALITKRIGGRWISHLEEELQRLEPLATDAGFQAEWQAVKSDNKFTLTAFIKAQTGTLVDPRSLFDIQVKRLHEYKRQHLNVLYLVTLYNRLKRAPDPSLTPRTVIFGGKAAPSYRMAKLIIRLINGVAAVVNQDPDVSPLLKVVFLPDFNVKNSQRVYPAADLSEQISTAGKEASGTGNMKFAMNGALTVGTLDGANVEIREAVGAENFFLFGLTVPEVQELRRRGYNPWDVYRQQPDVKRVVDAIGSGVFSPGEPRLFQPVIDSLLNGGDPFLVLADFAAYAACQEQVSRAWLDYERWTRMAILNVARTGRFSSDRSIREYAEQIWDVGPIPVG